MRTLLKLASVIVALGAATAEAADFNFAYRASWGAIGGRLSGSLQGDGNTIVVDSVADFVRIDGGASPALPFVYSSDSFYGGTAAPFVTIDGSAMSLLACATLDCDLDGFAFDTTGNLDVFPFYGTGGAFDPPGQQFAREVFAPGQWLLSAVPEPAAWAMLVAGFGLVGAVSRRRRISSAA